MKFECGNCGCEISEYRFKHSDRLCESCFKIIYGIRYDTDSDILGHTMRQDFTDKSCSSYDTEW